MIIDERGPHGKRGSSSRAKKLEAANEISLARFSSRTSRSRSLIRFPSSVVVPRRFPASMSACLAQPRSVSGFTPLLPILGHRGRCRQLRGFLTSLPHDPDRPVPQLLGILPRCWHGLTLHPSLSLTSHHIGGGALLPLHGGPPPSR